MPAETVESLKILLAEAVAQAVAQVRTQTTAQKTPGVVDDHLNWLKCEIAARLAMMWGWSSPHFCLYHHQCYELYNSHELHEFPQKYVLIMKLHECEEEVLAELDEIAAVEWDLNVIKCAMIARRYVLDQARTGRCALDAENEITTALGVCSINSMNGWKRAARLIRDVFVLRIQLLTPLHSRSMFEASLKDAYGAEIPRDINANYMNARTKTVYTLFPEHAFPSMGKTRGHTRRRLHKKKQRKAEVAADEQ